MKRLLLIAALCALFVLAACGGSYSRGQFAGIVVGATGQQILDRVGKPDHVEASDGNRQVWVYTKRTFDPANLNRIDEKTRVIVERDAQGVLVGREVLYG